GPDILKDIVVLKLDKLAKRMAESHKIKLTYSPKVVEQIASRCTEVETGARNIDHIMNGTILPQMSREILARLSEGAMPSETKLDVDKAGTFKITFGG
ncbi:MAG: type VI secretion system ATPase TssH, partial [Deltaproteobacteria bacterium]